MREDQYNKLADLQEKLCNVVLYEADPDNWPGCGKHMKDLTQEERGDRYWSKKNAAATLTLLNKVATTGMRSTKPGQDSEDESDDFDRQMQRAEADAAKILKRFQERHAK